MSGGDHNQADAEPNPLYPGHNRMDTRPRVDRRFVTPWERVE